MAVEACRPADANCWKKKRHWKVFLRHEISRVLLLHSDDQGDDDHQSDLNGLSSCIIFVGISLRVLIAGRCNRPVRQNLLISVFQASLYHQLRAFMGLFYMHCRVGTFL